MPSSASSNTSTQAGSGGLLSQAVNATKKQVKDPVQAASVSATSHVQDLNPKATVAHQVENLLSKDSTLMQRARHLGTQQSRQRGLLNSSISVGAATGAMADKAIEIGKEDASHYANRQMQNVQELNTTARFNAGETNTTNRFNAAETNQASMADRQAGHTLDQIEASGTQDRLTQGDMITHQQTLQENDLQSKADLLATDIQGQKDLLTQQGDINLTRDTQQQAHDTAMQELKGQQSVDLANIEADYKQLLQTNASAAQMYQAYVQSLGQIMSDPKMTPNQIQAAATTLRQSFIGQLDVLSGISGLDLSGYASAPVPGTGTTAGTGAATTGAGAVAPYGYAPADVIQQQYLTNGATGGTRGANGSTMFGRAALLRRQQQQQAAGAA